ncbi:hypothetical protein [Halobacterium jilantaiense]|uniref:Uncharacterized protein n=1 Tax=Halobacterium jilantaiense TaxID=355548 RepID=A0A1I0PJK8_9EURY|nr:hypothetical protein [Halobacterium jilantaiense]SEW13980.1 hypothetical protein SAMN04487945_1703 [Halobacterium jilantaiense]
MSASRGSRWFVSVGVAYLVAFQVATAAGAGRTTLAVLGVHGFVVHVLLGKAQALVPTYFDRNLAAPWIARAALPLTAVGGAVTAGWLATGSSVLAHGASVWALGVAVVVGLLLASLRGNLTGRETGTGDHNAHRRRVDRAANAAVPVALAYLAAGAYQTAAAAGTLVPLPALAGGLPVGVHLVAAGGALLALFAVGFRLFPRFLVATPPRPLVAVVLLAGALAPALLAADFYGGALFRAGAALEAVAVVGFAVAYAVLHARSDRSRVGLRAVLAAVASGVVGVGLGVAFATGALAPTAGRVLAHLRLNVLGLLGLAVVGALYQFYPPSVGRLPGCDDRLALASVTALAVGVWVEAAGRLAGSALVATGGAALGVAGALAVAYLVGAAFLSRT